MLSREEVVSKYQTLFQDKFEADHPAFRWIDQLPPSLCRALILGNGLKTAANSIEQAYVGSVKSDIRNISGINVSVGKFNNRIFNSLPLQGHTPLEVPGMCDWIHSALAVLEILDSKALAFIKQWCSMILWVAPDANTAPKTLLTSVAIPTLPHCTILSVKSLRHIPAKHVYEGASTYALAENIFHEALHQQLSASLVFGSKLMCDADAANLSSVHIPWRNASWEIDRVIHAAWVYSNLQKLRLRALSMPNLLGSEITIVKNAENESRPKLEFLSTKLESIQSFLPRASRQIIEQVLA